MPSKPPYSGRYPAREFDQAAKTTGMAELSIAIARSILVDGMTIRAAAELHGRSAPWAAKAAANMRAVLEAENPTPVGWVRDSATLPPKLWVTVRKMEAQAREELRASRQKTPAPRKKR